MIGCQQEQINIMHGISQPHGRFYPEFRCPNPHLIVFLTIIIYLFPKVFFINHKIACFDQLMMEFFLKFLFFVCFSPSYYYSVYIVVKPKWKLLQMPWIFGYKCVCIALNLHFTPACVWSSNMFRNMKRNNELFKVVDQSKATKKKNPVLR